MGLPKSLLSPTRGPGHRLASPRAGDSHCHLPYQPGPRGGFQPLFRARRSPKVTNTHPFLAKDSWRLLEPPPMALCWRPCVSQ